MKLLQNKFISELDEQFQIADIDKKLLTENINFDGVNFLNKTKDMLEVARASGLDIEDYNKYNQKLNGYYYSIAKEVKENTGNYKSGGLFLKSNTLYDVVSTIDNNMSGLDQFSKNQVLGQAMSILSQNGVDLQSKDLSQKQNAEKIINDVIDGYYNIPANTPNRNEIIMQKKRQKDAEQNQTYFNETLYDKDSDKDVVGLKITPFTIQENVKEKKEIQKIIDETGVSEIEAKQFYKISNEKNQKIEDMIKRNKGELRDWVKPTATMIGKIGGAVGKGGFEIIKHTASLPNKANKRIKENIKKREKEKILNELNKYNKYNKNNDNNNKNN